MNEDTMSVATISRFLADPKNLSDLRDVLILDDRLRVAQAMLTDETGGYFSLEMTQCAAEHGLRCLGVAQNFRVRKHARDASEWEQKAKIAATLAKRLVPLLTDAERTMACQMIEAGPLTGPGQVGAKGLIEVVKS